MSVSAAYGQVITGRDVELEVTEHLQAWFPDALAEIERQSTEFDHDNPETALREVQAWERADDVLKWPESDLPAIVVVNQGFADYFDDGSGVLRANATFGVLAVTSASTRDNTATLAKLYSAAVLMVFSQHPGIDGFAEGTMALSQGWNPLPLDDKSRSMAAGYTLFRASVPGVVNTRGGLLEPSDDPYTTPPDPQTPLTRHLEVTKR